jgi:ABC-type molybdate transport system permease subunit
LISSFLAGFGSAHGTGEKERRLLDAGHKFRHGSASVILDTNRDSLVRGTETRIFAWMLAVSFPVFAHSILHAVKDVSRELLEMMLAFGPTRIQVLRLLILPSIVPSIFTV